MATIHNSVFIICTWVLILFYSCGSDDVKIPENILPADKMVQVLADVQVTEAVIHYKNGRGDKAELKAPGYYQYIFTKHQITEKQFRESYVFYLNQDKLMDKIVEEVINEISRKQAEAANK